MYVMSGYDGSEDTLIASPTALTHSLQVPTLIAFNSADTIMIVVPCTASVFLFELWFFWEAGAGVVFLALISIYLELSRRLKTKSVRAGGDSGKPLTLRLDEGSLDSIIDLTDLVLGPWLVECLDSKSPDRIMFYALVWRAPPSQESNYSRLMGWQYYDPLRSFLRST